MTMPSMSRLALLLLGLTLTPASCLPHSDHHRDARSVHSARAAPAFKMPGWEIVVIILGLVVGLILVGMLGGACETLICMHFKRPVRADPGENAEGLDFGCQGQPGGMPEIKVIAMEEKGAGDKMSNRSVDSGLGRSNSSNSGISSNSGGSSRYSWQDDKGVTTEMYLDGSLPDARPGATAHDTMGTIQYHGYQVQDAMRGYQGVHYQDPAVGLASNPPFVLHNEEDDSDYDHDDEGSDPSQHSQAHLEFAVAVSTDDVVSPLTPETQSTTWPHQAVSAEQAARYFAAVDLEDGYVHDKDLHYDSQSTDLHTNENTFRHESGAKAKPTRYV